MRPIGWMRRMTAALVCCAVATSACATATGPRVAPPAAAGPAVSQALAEYVQRLPAGAPVRVDRAGASSVRGTIIKASAEAIVIQPRTRVAVPPIEIPMRDVLRVTPDTGTGNVIAKAIGIGAAAGVGAALAVFAILAAILSD